MSKLSIIIPTMNEERSIGQVIDAIHDSLPPGLNYEILIVDTDSRDRTREIADSKGARIIDEPRRGYGIAYKTGFQNAEGEIIATLDADMTYPAEKISELIQLLESERIDFITTNRFADLQPGAMRFAHQLGNKLLSIATRLLFRVKIRDSQSGMWVFKKEILPLLRLTSDGMPLSEEIKIEAFRKVKAIEVPIRYSPRMGEVKLNTWKDGVKNMKFLFRKRLWRAN